MANIDREYFETDQRINEFHKYLAWRFDFDDPEMCESDLRAFIAEWLRWDSSPEYKWKGLNAIMLECWEPGIQSFMCIAIEAAHGFLKEQGWLMKAGSWQISADYFLACNLPNKTRHQIAQIAGHWVVLDIETTGLKPGFDKIIRIDAVRFELGTVSDAFSILVNPEMEISDDVVAFTGITNAEASGAFSFAEAMEELVDFVANNVVVVHNADFVQKFFQAQCANTKIPNAALDVLCTHEIAREHFPNMRNDIESLATRLNLENTTEHPSLFKSICSAQFLRDAEVVSGVVAVS